MIETILLSSVLSFAPMKDKPYQPKKEPLEVYFSKEGLVSEETLAPKPYESEYFKKI